MKIRETVKLGDTQQKLAALDRILFNRSKVDLANDLLLLSLNVAESVHVISLFRHLAQSK